MNYTKQLTKLLLAGAVLCGAIARAQNPATNPPPPPSPAPAANPAAPCVAAPASHKQIGMIHLPGESNPNSPVNRACQKLGLCASDPNERIVLPTGEAKPCPPSPAPGAATTPVAATAPESKPVISDDGRHLYVCPKNASKVADLPVCQTADHSFVPLIEIPVPAGSLIKVMQANSGASAVNANPAANNTTTPLTDAKPNPNAATTPTH